MALYPCSVDGARYRGAQQTMYPALVAGSDSERAHLRLCPSHFDDLHDYCRQHLEEVVYDTPAPSQEQLPVCSFCGGDVANHKLVFVTVYATRQEETQFYGRACARCLTQVATKLHIRH